jgi:osmotically inducible protein OsmC
MEHPTCVGRVRRQLAQVLFVWAMPWIPNGEVKACRRTKGRGHGDDSRVHGDGLLVCEAGHDSVQEEVMMKRSANATWNGDLKSGTGTFGVASGVIKDQKFGFRTRFEDAPGTNPEELIAAAHASCFSMAFSAQLGERGIVPQAIETTSTITFENLTLTKSLLKTTVRAPGVDTAKVREAAAAAKAGCPISKVLKLEIVLELTVVS